MTICPLWDCLPEIIVTVEDIRVVDGHHFVAANSDGQLLNDSPAQFLNNGPVGIFTVQRDRKGQSCGSGNNVFAKVGEPDKQLLVRSMLLGLLVMTTDCRTPLTPKGSRRERCGLSLRPNLLEAIMY